MTPHEIYDGDFTVRLLRYAKKVGAETLDELRESLESEDKVYINGTVIIARTAMYYNKKRILEELNSYPG